jgi:hypothetical protein
MSSVTWVILIGGLVVLLLAALAGSRSAGSPGRRFGAWVVERNTREVVASEGGIILGSVLFALGLLLDSGFLVLLGVLLVAAAFLRLVIHRGPPSSAEVH